MSCACEGAASQPCGCCTGVATETPELITNRPALGEISYRVGRYSTFNASMLASLSQAAYSPMSLLRTRDGSDFSIALLDAWAVSLDILTFYQERLANEAFIRTAVDQRSVFELSRLVGYVPSPGVAASAVVAFTLSSAPGSPDNVLIPASTRVQSVPGPGQAPQVFETSTDLVARIGYNALPAQTTNEWSLSAGDQSMWIQGTANKIHVGDALLFVAASGGAPIATGPGEVHYVTTVELNSVANVTKITWDTEISSALAATSPTADAVCVFIFRKKAALFGAQAPSPAGMTFPNNSGPRGYAGTGATDWNYAQYVTGSQQVNLDASYPGLAPIGSPPSPPLSQWVVLTGLGYTSFFQILKAVESSPNLYLLTTKTTQLTLDKGQILTGDTALSIDGVLGHFVAETRNITAYVQSEQLTPARPPTAWASSQFALEADVPAPISGGALSIVGGQQIAPGQPIGVSGRRVRLSVLPGAGATFTPNGSTASISVADNQTFLVDAFPPVSASGSSTWTAMTLSGIVGLLDATDTTVVLIPADKRDPIVGEAAVVSATSPNGDLTNLALASPLARIYDASTTTVNANAVETTHGETVQEILGSGDATNHALQFSLKQSPLTYVTSTTNNGAQSTLQVWVNNLRWQETPNLLSSSGADRAFVTRANPTGNVTVQFGDGVQGALTPTGQSNVRAIYRKGIGSAGMVNAGQLTQALDRPQGLTSVTNPSPASGAADPASADDARSSAPLPTLTLGRVVSLEDYQNFALAFPGIAKAVASWTSFSGTRGVFLTVVGANGAVLSPSDPILVNLATMLRSRGNPYVRLRIAPYQPVPFQVTARVSVNTTDYDPTQVLATVWGSLTTAFAFANRLLSQDVAASEVISLIQNTPGVVAVQLQGLSPSGSPSSVVPPILCASAPRPPNGAQMLLLDPASQGTIGAWS